ncbi:hypothetical protein BGY98DRAFT_523620 [Russula aff. rugulosa BPL654]|nr:hypothetical protein BGY98DRAFT_523620 [Russula aff. rugulosa BPL654]
MGEPISEEIQWIIVRLSTAMSPEDVAMYTGVGQRKVNDVMSTFNKYGTVKVYTHQEPDDDIQHVFQTLEAPPDLYLDELRQDLEFKTGKSVSIPTIWRMLRRAHVLLWNGMLRLMPSLVLALVNIDLINLYLLMRVPLTVE